MKPIYIPKGAAKEYGDYAINIYTGCPHGCFSKEQEGGRWQVTLMRTI